MKCMWNVKTKVIPVIIGATGTISKPFRKYVSNIPGNHGVKELQKITILWNPQVQTDRTIANNKPDVIIRNNEKGTCMLIDVALSGDRNVIKKEAEKTLQ